MAAERGRLGRLGLRGFALGYLLLLLVIPVSMIFVRVFEAGIAESFESITTPAGLHAFWLTLVTVIVSVPLNAAFGVLCAIVLVRHRFRGKALLNALIDIPFAVSPVVIGLALLLLYAPNGSWLGPWLVENGIQVIFSTPGIVLACVFVSLPFVVREVVPVLHEVGDDAEQAAATLGASRWQTFRRITLPAIRWGVIYGVVLSTARVLGEFGAVSVVSGRISGQTETLPLIVSKQFELINPGGAFAAAMVLAVLALLTLLTMNLIKRKEVN
jgi:sulfate/thiosulfate transport system permease protein